MNLAQIAYKQEIARQVPYWEVESVWDKVSPLLEKVISVQDEWDMQTVFNKLRMAPENQPLPFQLWYLPGKFAIVTQIQQFPKGTRKLLLFLCGGEDPRAVSNTVSHIEQWAKKYHGVSKSMISGRRGWIEFLDGYGVTNYVMEKDLCNS